MGKTYEALMQADREKSKKPEAGMNLESSRIHPIPQGVNIPLPILEEYHRMEYKISSWYPEKKSRALVFVGPSEGEGNSTVLTHFGISMAFRGESVLLVDMDWRRPSIHRFFDLPTGKGSIEWIFDQCTLEEAIQNTYLENLHVITSGTIPVGSFPTPPSLFLDYHIKNMKSKANWILIDAPPINASNDAIALAPKVDGVIMVVKAEKTRWEVAQNARQRIESGEGNILGVVLNDRRYYIPEWLYQRLG